MTNFEQKKNDDPLDVHLAIRLEILAGIRGNIGISTAGLGSDPWTSAVGAFPVKLNSLKNS